jgi:hypothetical protein
MPRFPYKPFDSSTKFGIEFAKWINNFVDSVGMDLKETETNFNNAVETVSNKAFDKVVGAAKIEWLPPVNTFEDLETTYPNASEGKTVMTRDSGKIYRFDDENWIEIQDIDPSAINEVDNRLTAELATESQKIETVKSGLEETNRTVNDLVIIPRKLALETTHSPAIKRALDQLLLVGRGTLYIPFLEIIINEPIIFYSYIRYRGNTKMGTKVRLADGANCDIFKSHNFELLSLMHNNGIYPDNHDDLLPVGFYFSDFFLDGNYFVFDENGEKIPEGNFYKVNNTEGFGIKIYAKNFEMENIRVENIPEVGAYVECRDSETGKISFQLTRSGKEGFIYRGPNDATLDRINVGKTGESAIKNDGSIDSTLNRSSVYDGQPIHGAIVDAPIEGNEIHSWECWTGQGIWYTPKARSKTKHLVVDNCRYGVLLDNCQAQLPMVDCHNVLSNVLVCQGDISQTVNLVMYRYSTDKVFGDQVIINGNNKELGILDRDGSLVSGAGIVVNGSHNVNLTAIMRNYTNGDVLKYQGGYRNKFELTTENCKNVLGIEKNMFLSEVYIKAMLKPGQTLYEQRNGFTIDFGRTPFKVLASIEENDTIIRNLLGSYNGLSTNSIDLNSTEEQIITIPHMFYRIPFAHEIVLRLNSNASAIGYEVAYVKTTAITDTNVEVRVKLSTPCSISGAKGSIIMNIQSLN